MINTILLIIGIIAAIMGLICLIKLDIFLPFLNFYYNSKKPLKPIAWKGGLGAKHVREFGRTRGILIWARIFGMVLMIVGIAIIFSSF